jgi:hypothetical protein
MAGARVFLLLIGCVMFLFVAVAIGIGVGFWFMYRRRFMRAIGVPTQAVGILEDWAADEGCELLKADWPEDRRHPFADRFGVGLGKQPAIVLAVKVRTRHGDVRRGWAYLRQGYLPPRLLPESLEVVWDE